jgi:hypothetical protein
MCCSLALAKLVNYAPRETLQIVASFTDEPRGVIYDHKMFKVQVPGVAFTILHFLKT